MPSADGQYNHQEIRQIPNQGCSIADGSGGVEDGKQRDEETR